ncbi:MAG: hypothetical protein IKT98_10695 [Selenomonadaceae bacterium]|nr:hypothetical protein [Selenomonadaceae bacterium]
MTIAEFDEKYYLHDSSIENIDFDANKKVLKFKIFFCFWMQLWYDKNEPPNGWIRVTFNDVSCFEYYAAIADRIFDAEIDSEIRSSKLDKDGNFTIFAVDTDFNSERDDIYYLLKINAASVEVEELERYKS